MGWGERTGRDVLVTPSRDGIGEQRRDWGAVLTWDLHFETKSLPALLTFESLKVSCWWLLGAQGQEAVLIIAGHFQKLLCPRHTPGRWTSSS